MVNIAHNIMLECICKCKTINHNNMNKHPFIPAPAVVAFLFGLLCMSALSSCTGCSYNHEKAMGSIDNILGKVDTLMAKTDRFWEEHLPEEPPIDYEKEGG